MTMRLLALQPCTLTARSLFVAHSHRIPAPPSQSASVNVIHAPLTPHLRMRLHQLVASSALPRSLDPCPPSRLLVSQKGCPQTLLSLNVTLGACGLGVRCWALRPLARAAPPAPLLNFTIHPHCTLWHRAAMSRCCPESCIPPRIVHCICSCVLVSRHPLTFAQKHNVVSSAVNFGHPRARCVLRSSLAARKQSVDMPLACILGLGNPLQTPDTTPVTL